MKFITWNQITSKYFDSIFMIVIILYLELKGIFVFEMNKKLLEILNKKMFCRSQPQRKEDKNCLLPFVSTIFRSRLILFTHV